MEKISSFKINHDTHTVGLHLSSVNKDVFTYDLRFKKPNGGDYISNAAAHTIEHLFATVIRNGEIKENVIYFGPMGCRTGFYLLLRDIAPDTAKIQIITALKQCLELDTVPGNAKIECGNYRSHNLKAAKRELSNYLAILTTEKLTL
jgi:S-ribosylhomocysteine lyase